jgi:DNA-directed RNA polymerase subunit RPC12/RpoP
MSLRLAQPVAPLARLPRPDAFKRVRFYRCTDCMKPWNDEADFAANTCPLCGSPHILVDPPRRAAA